MKYSKSDSEYFRNKKGGGLETNGKLNNSNFSAQEVELNEIGSSTKIKIKPIKIMVKKKSKFNEFRKKLPNFLKSKDEHYVFFGFNPQNDIYEYVMYVNPDFAGYKLNPGLPIICKKREDNGTIIDVTPEQFLNINIKELSILIYNLLLRNQQNNILLDQTFFKYLLDFVFPKILEKSSTVNNKNLDDIIVKIKNILKNQKNNANNNANNNNIKLPKKEIISHK
jgi:hypothetical protein